MENNQKYPPSLITLTSDFGWKDYYLALLKGAMLSKQPHLNIVDITHEIQNYDIVRAAFIFKNAWAAFPRGTIHVLSVNDLNDETTRFVLIQHDGHYFIGPNNGVFSLVFDNKPIKIYQLPAIEKTPFTLKDIFAEAVDHIVKGLPIEEIGEPIDSLLTRITFQPITGQAQIRGAIIHVDNYENAITNITKDIFDKIGQNRPFKLSFKGHDPISTISQHYHDVPVGETLCLFNSADHLEIAINMGSASGLLSMGLEDTVQLDFLDI